MRVAITGSNGYVGGLTCAELKRRGHDVVRLLRWEAPVGELHPGVLIGPGYKNTAQTAEADVLLLLGGLFIPTHSCGDSKPLVAHNVAGPAELCDAFLESRTLGVVHAGTSWQSVMPHGRPSNPYAASRQAAWTVIRAIADAYGKSAISLRVADTFGPADPRSKLFGLLRMATLQNNPLDMSPGQQIVDPAYAPDVAKAFVLACELAASESLSGEWSVAGGEPMKLVEKVRAFERAIGRPIPVNWGARAYRRGEPMEPVLLSRPNWWTGTVTFEEGVRLTESEPGGLLASHDALSP